MENQPDVPYMRVNHFYSCTHGQFNIKTMLSRIYARKPYYPKEQIEIEIGFRGFSFEPKIENPLI